MDCAELIAPLPIDTETIDHVPTGASAGLVCAAPRPWRDAPFHAEIRRWFGGTRSDLLFKRQAYPMYDLPQLYQAFAACFADWQLMAEGGGIDSRPGSVWAPQTTRMLVAPRRWADYASETTRFYRLPGGGHRALVISEVEEWGPDGFRIHFIGPRAQEEGLTAEFDALLQRMKRPHYLHGQVLKPGGTPLEGFEPATWDDVALEPAARAAIEQNTVEVFRRREAFRRNGVPLKRGVLIYGPPGTGKTLLAKALAGRKLATFLYVTAADMVSPDEVRAAFHLVRKLAPSIVFFEDIDLYADDRSAYCSKAILGEMLAQLDGFENNDGVVFMATTNDLGALDPAIRERPSRFDVVLGLGLPSREARRAILTRNLPPGCAGDSLLDEAALATEGLSGAQVREVAYLTLQRAILRDACDAQGRATPDDADFAHAVKQVTGTREEPIGFRPG